MIRPVRIELKHLNIDQIIHMLLVLMAMVGIYIGVSWVLIVCAMLLCMAFIVRQLPSVQASIPSVDLQFSGRVLIDMLYAIMLLSAYGLILGASGLVSYWDVTVLDRGDGVALGTSLPEFSAALVSHHRGRMLGF